MDPFSSFFSASFLFYCFSIFALTFIIRTIVEYFIHSAKTSNIWNNLLLPILPLLMGGVSGIFAKLYPDPLGTSIFAREVFGLTAGLLSGLVYKMLKGYLKAQFPSISLPSDTSPTASDIPPAPSVAPSSPSATSTTIAPDASQTTGGMSQDVHPNT